MKLLPRLILACATLATCTVAGAQAYGSAADQERRARNREEALARYHASPQGSPSSSTRAVERSPSAGKPTLGERSRKAATSVRSFTERQADKARRFSDRQDRKWGPAKSTNRSKTGGTPD